MTRPKEKIKVMKKWESEQGELFFNGYKEAISDIRALIEDFKDILKNNKNPEFKEYNELLLNDIDEILKEIEGEEK